MSLLPEEVFKKIPPLHAQDELPDGELYAYAKLTVDTLGYVFFVLEIAEDQDTFSGYLIDPLKEQFGYFSFDYLERNLPFPIELDQSFASRKLVDAVRSERGIQHQKGFGIRSSEILAPHRAYYVALSYNTLVKDKFLVIKKIVRDEDMNLSVYHFPIGTYKIAPLIVIIGDWPSKRIHQKITEVLQGGTPIILEYDFLMQLAIRKREQNAKGGYQESQRKLIFKKRKGRGKRK